MRTVKLFFVFSLIASAMFFPLRGMHKDPINDQDFDNFFTQRQLHDLSPFKSKLGKKSIRSPLFGRGVHDGYPLEYALHVWVPRIQPCKRGTKSSVQYTDELVFGWISRLLENGAPCTYSDFNPLVCLLYQYDQGDITRNLFEQLVQLLCKYGARVDDNARDQYTMRVINNNTRYGLLDPLATFISNKGAASVQDILDNVAQSKILKAAEIRDLFTKKHDESVHVDTDEFNGRPNPWITEPACKPCLFTRQQLVTVACISFACMIGVKCLYDWYFNADAQDEPIAEENTPTA